MSGNARTVPHLGGIQVGYRLSSDSADSSKPTLVLFNPFTTTTDYYSQEFQSEELTRKLNLLAIEPLGHGRTRSKTDTFTYWDSAIISLQLLDSLGIAEAFVLGVSQGGWIATRMALLAPDRIKGIIPVGSSMDFESPRSREKGCWDGPSACSGLVTLAGDLAPAPEFEPGNDYCAFILGIGYGKVIDEQTKDFWYKKINEDYRGDQGKRRITMAAVTLAGRDGLHERLSGVRCPVLWLQGDADVVFSLENAEEEIKMFTNSAQARLVPFPGGVHFLTYTHAEKVHREVLGFIDRWAANSKPAF